MRTVVENVMHRRSGMVLVGSAVISLVVALVCRGADVGSTQPAAVVLPGSRVTVKDALVKSGLVVVGRIESEGISITAPGQSWHRVTVLVESVLKGKSIQQRLDFLFRVVVFPDKRVLPRWGSLMCFYWRRVRVAGLNL